MKKIYELTELERAALEDRLKESKFVEKYSYEFEDTAMNINGDYFLNTEEIEEYLRKEESKLRMRTNKAICACGSEMKVVNYEGYYDSFKYLECVNQDCTYLDTVDADRNDKGSYA